MGREKRSRIMKAEVGGSSHLSKITGSTVRTTTNASSQLAKRHHRRGLGEESCMVHESALRRRKCDLVAVGLHIIVYHRRPNSVMGGHRNTGWTLWRASDDQENTGRSGNRM